jgi:hypothetical protein
MDKSLFYLINIARTQPASFKERLLDVSFNGDKVLVGLDQWEIDIKQEDVTELKDLIVQELPELHLGKIHDDYVILNYPKEYPDILIAISVCFKLKNTIFNPDLIEISISCQEIQEYLEFKISFRYQTEQTLTKSKINRNYHEKIKKIAYEIVENPIKRKKFKRMMLEGNEWINDLAKLFGPFTGYELNEFISWFKTAEQTLPKKKYIPQAKDPKPPVPLSKTILMESSKVPEFLSTSNTINIKPNTQNIVEASTNSFNVKEGEYVKFTFRSKQRYNDIKDAIKSNKGNASERLIKRLPERNSEESPKEPHKQKGLMI